MKKVILLITLFAFLALGAEIITVTGDETIQDAIDRAADGDTVIVPEGTYAGTILIEKNLVLQGEGNAILTPPTDFGSANSLLIVRGDNANDAIVVTIQNLNIQNSVDNPIKYGVFFWENLTAYFYNNTVEGFNIEDGTSYGTAIICHDSNGGEVSGNTFTNNAGSINISNSVNMLIQNNTVSEFTKWGISSGSSIDCTFTGNSISSTQEYLLYGFLIGNSSYGILVNDNDIDLPTYSLLIEGSHPDSLYNVRPYGISVSTGGDFDNTIQDNVIEGCARSIENESNQFGLITITGNTFGEMVSPSFAAIFFDGGNANIVENTFADTVRSIEFVNTGNINVTGNIFTGMSYDGLSTINLQHDCFGTVTISENSFGDSREVNIWNQSSMLTGDTLDATYNWWGDIYPLDNIVDLTAPIAPDTTWTPAKPVDYTPWYLDATMDELVWSVDTTISADLNPGWNLWSSNITIVNDSIEVVLAPIMDNLVKVKSILESYDPDLPSTFNTLSTIDNGKAYWINVDALVTLELSGTPLAVSTDIDLSSGWNLVAFIPQEAYAVEYAFAILINNSQLVKVKSIMESYDPLLPSTFNTLEFLEPTNGYWVNVNTDLIFHYPEAARSAVNTTEHNYYWNPVIYTNSTCAYAHIDLMNGQIGAFVDGECRAVTEITNGYVSLVINGEEPEAVHFKLFHNGSVTELDASITTAPGEDIFFEFESYIPVSTRLNGAYPNPFNPETTISFELAQASDVAINIYNVRGQKVAELVNDHFNTGVHSVTWNAANQASGVYFMRLQTDNESTTQKVILMK
ncbi:MAG: right-handed parallel beta-helix repeat-containing protein [Candidatus Stygibacter australis]|nr:right-handed parallel beta-helix repeat-containing protein [Candidatus Stygibacter australis]MDP8323350.1 right-handed parallel beta-helix repeat-containing protein [Candidatus Stygibacter australis]